MVRELKHTEIGDIPIDWELQTFEETFSVLSSNTLSRENLNSRCGVVRNIHYGDILTKFPEILDCEEAEIPYINDLSLLTSSAQLLQDGDIVIADTAEDETVGKVTEVINLGTGKLVAGLHTIPCRVKKGDFVPGWLGYYMNSHMYHKQIIPYITGIKVASISKSAIAETIIVIPPIEEQKRIVEILSQTDLLIQKEQEVINKITAVKKVCLSKMFPKEGENIPEMRLPGFEGDWEWCKLGDEVIEILAGGDIDKSKIVEMGRYPIYANALTDGGIVQIHATKEVLDNLLDDEYLTLSYPKSTGREKYNSVFLDNVIKECLKYTTKNEDIITTLTAYTAATIVKEYELFLDGVEKVVVAGGGANNKYIITSLHLLNQEV